MHLIALISSALLLFSSLAIAGVLEGTVVHIADGDTITVLDIDLAPDSWTFLKL